MNIKILKELEEYILPLSKEEKTLLENSITSEGCREPLITWKDDEEDILIDGHNRYRICIKHNIPFQTRSWKFVDLDEAKEWMINNQLGRRNLTPDQMSYYRGLKYNAFKMKKGGHDKVLSKGSSGSTSELLANEFKVSEKTIKRDAKFSDALSVVGKNNSDLKNAILTGNAKIKKSDLQLILKHPEHEGFRLKNLADLENKINEVKKELDLFKKDAEKVSAEEDKRKEVTDPLFLSREDRLRQIKGQIMSKLNQAILKTDTQHLKEARELIDKIEMLIHR